MTVNLVEIEFCLSSFLLCSRQLQFSWSHTSNVAPVIAFIFNGSKEKNLYSPPAILLGCYG